MELLAPALVQAGFRVLRYDMFGHGQSACPRCAYDRALLLRQLSELLDALHLTALVNLADHGSILQPAQRLDHLLAGIFSAPGKT